MKKSKTGGKQTNDHLSPTKLETPKPVKGPEKTNNLTHGELQNKLKVYGKTSEMLHQPNVVQDLKEKYQEQISKDQKTRTKQDINYSMGVRSGLPHNSYETMKQGRETKSQDYRDQIAKEAKARYRQGDNLTKQFQAQQPDKKQLGQEFKQAKSKQKGNRKK